MDIVHDINEQINVTFYKSTKLGMTNYAPLLFENVYKTMDEIVDMPVTDYDWAFYQIALQLSRNWITRDRLAMCFHPDILRGPGKDDKDIVNKIKKRGTFVNAYIFLDEILEELVCKNFVKKKIVQMSRQTKLIHDIIRDDDNGTINCPFYSKIK